MEIKELKSRIRELEEENSRLKRQFVSFQADGPTVSVPEQFKPIFDDAEALVANYFKKAVTNPTQGIIEINEERYVLLRASSLSVDFMKKVKSLYADKGEEEAFSIGRNFLFDIAHVIGLEDAKNFHGKMKVEDPIAKLSAGPVHFAYTGWAFVDILPESNPAADDTFYLKYHHPYSFEADAWLNSKEKSDSAVCIMNAGYSSGWCEQSFGIPLTAVEISCKAKGDDNCTFIMAPPHKIEEYIESEGLGGKDAYEVPLFFERQKAAEQIRQSLHEKEVLLKEVHHRVKNNLQIISSLLNLQLNYLNNDEANFLFKETQNRIRTLALVHEKLYKSEDVEFVDLAVYIRSIVDLLGYSFNKEFIDVNYSFDMKHLEKFNVDQAIPCGLIVNEIISNSFKYAFPKSFKGQINISLKKEGSFFKLVINDNGIGIPPEVDLNSPDSLGIELIYSLVSQLEGEIVISREDGTQYEITFP